tara:strand:+ start:45850 stop:48009 length:2160 start_codon:yes stop_codon:yes gene_type:complete
MKNPQLLVNQLRNLLQPFMVLALVFLGSTMNTVSAQNWNEVIKAVASDRGAGDRFGRSVAISGDYAIVGAPLEDHDTTGANLVSNAGSAYIFQNISGTWTEVQKLVASDRGSGDEFGWSVAISGDYAIVGAIVEDHDTTGGNTLTDAGSAYIFQNIAGTWTEVQKLVASDRGVWDWFGYSVAISGDYSIVGAVLEDHDTTGGNSRGDAGAAYIFKNNAGTWSEVQKLVASDRSNVDYFGNSVAISGDYAIVGAPEEDHDTTGGNSVSQAGSAYLFKNNAGTWSEVQKLVTSDRGSNDYFGYSVAISGEIVIVGAYQESHDTTGGASLSAAGSAYIFKNNAGTWSETQKLVASDREAQDQFGISVAISGEYAIVGASLEDHDTTGGNTLTLAGSTYLFKNNAGSWTEAQKLVASDREAQDRFGYSVAISGDYAIVGAIWEDHDTTGGAFRSNAGSAYLFKNCVSRITDVRTACDSLTWIDSVTYTSSNNTARHTLVNAAGCDSVVTLNLTIYNSTTNDTVTACESYTWNANNITYTTSGNYKDTLVNAASCDSVVTLNLTINSVSDLTTSASGTTISANNTNATYQWLDCGNNNALIVGDTGQTFTATANGSFAVELTENGCVDTSACVQIIIIGIVENSFGDDALLVYPNPTNGNFSIDLGAVYQNAEISIRDISGKLIDSRTIAQSQVLNLTLDQPAGIYIISVQAANKRAVIRLVKQ